MGESDEGEEIEAFAVKTFRVRSDPKLPLDAVLLNLEAIDGAKWYLLRVADVDRLVQELQGWRAWMKTKMS